MNKNGKKIMAVVGTLGVLSGALAGGLVIDSINSNNMNQISNELVKANAKLENTKSELKNLKENPITETVVETEIKEVEVPVEKIVEVDNGNLDSVLNHIYDNDGDVEYLTEDLDDDELDLIVDRIDFISYVKQLTVDELEKEFADEVDGLMLNTTEFDDDDVEDIEVENDFEDIVVGEVDFDDEDAKVYMTVSFEQDEQDYEADVRVTVRDNEVDDIDILEIRED